MKYNKFCWGMVSTARQAKRNFNYANNWEQCEVNRGSEANCEKFAGSDIETLFADAKKTANYHGRLIRKIQKIIRRNTQVSIPLQFLRGEYPSVKEATDKIQEMKIKGMI
jgi:hypothetical protein